MVLIHSIYASPHFSQMISFLRSSHIHFDKLAPATFEAQLQSLRFRGMGGRKETILKLYWNYIVRCKETILHLGGRCHIFKETILHLCHILCRTATRHYII
jgi:hypothetical protein